MEHEFVIKGDPVSISIIRDGIRRERDAEESE